ncbi:HNH endonuclease [Prescottella equi]|uniref:HNH endonuclease n=1 Tax=Rhodococcus hoagii TaxID=43767 RepID=UPI000A0FD5AC
MAGETVCSIADCLGVAVKRGMCNSHYLRWWKSTPGEMRPRPTPEERFWAKVQKGPGCWEWQGARRPSGHGMFAVSRSRTAPAHSYALELALGYPCPSGMEACHRCDNPPCVNPRHIYFGTRQQNIDDAWARNRHQVGQDRPAAKLRDPQVIEIRERYALGADAKQLAAEFSIAVPTLRHIVLGLKWKHLGGPITRRRPSTKNNNRKAA